MLKVKAKTELIKQKSISLTAYRTLIVFAELLKHPCSKQQLIDLLSHGIHSEIYSKDTLRRTLNTLKKAGCVISRPTEKNGYLYTLISHPFLPKFTLQDAKCLNTIRSGIILSDDYKHINNINKLYEKIISFCSDIKIIEKITKENPFSSINSEILDKMINNILRKKVVEFSYFSANAGLEVLKFIPERVTMKNSKLYVFGYCFKYNQYSFLNVERIKDIISVYNMNSDFSLPSYEVKYKLTGLSLKTFVPEENECIEYKNDEEIVVKSNVSDEFYLFQRLLVFGADLKFISPDFVRERFLEKLYKIRERYFNAE